MKTRLVVGSFLFGSSLLLGGGLRGSSVLLLETVYPAFGVDQLLLAREERVAAGADFHANVALVGRPGLEVITARADDVNGFVVRMNSGFHGDTSFSLYQQWQVLRSLREMEPLGVVRSPEDGYLLSFSGTWEQYPPASGRTKLSLQYL
jgi:hypothetical protein